MKDSVIVAQVADLKCVLEVPRIVGIADYKIYRSNEDSVNEIIFDEMDELNHSIEVINLRSKIGYPTLREEFRMIENQLNKMVNHHENWLADVMFALNENSFDSLPELNSKECKLGKWIYQIHSHNSRVNMYLKRLEEPHELVHKLVKMTIDTIFNSNGKEELIDMMFESIHHKVSHTAEQIIDSLFKNFRGKALIIESENKMFAIVVDEIHEIKHSASLNMYKDEGVLNNFNDALIRSINYNTFVINVEKAISA